MSKKVKKTGIVIISMLIIILLAVIIYNGVYLPLIEDKQSTIKHLTLEYKTLDNCYDQLNCAVPYSDYATIGTDIPTTNLMNVLNSLNTKMDEVYNKSLNSTDMTTPECIEYSSLYKRSVMGENNLTIYDSDNLLGLTLLSRETNLCTSVSNEDLDVYVYDVKNDKVLTNDEIKEKYDITDAMISSTIEANVDAINEINELNFSTDINEYNLYIGNDGTIGVYYKQPEDSLYYNVLLNKQVK